MSTLTQNGVRDIPDDTGYVLPIVAALMNPDNDNTTYYAGSKAIPWQTTGALVRVYVPKAGTVKRAYIEWDAGTAGTNEDVTMNLRLNDTTDTLIATVGTNQAQKLFSNTALGVVVVAGDFIEVKVSTPAWGTNPANVAIGGQIYIE